MSAWELTFADAISTLLSPSSRAPPHLIVHHIEVGSTFLPPILLEENIVESSASMEKQRQARGSMALASMPLRVDGSHQVRHVGIGLLLDLTRLAPLWLILARGWHAHVQRPTTSCRPSFARTHVT